MLKAFDYHRPTDLNEACRLMADLPQAQVLAGGTDLLVDIDTGLRQARHVVSVSRITELRQIEQSDSKVSIGAACTAKEIQSSPLIRRHFPEITDMVPHFASPQIRARATVGGNICSAVACGDFPVILTALQAEIEVVSRRGRRIIPLKDFITGSRETVRKADEILTRILVPLKPSSAAACYLKFKRRASNSLAVASVASFVDIQNGICREARIVLGAVAPYPLPSEKAASALVGKEVEDDAIEQAASLARDDAKPITDVRGTEAYRRELVYVLTKHALKCSLERLKGQR